MSVLEPTIRFKQAVTKRKLTKRTVGALEPPAKGQAWTYDLTTARLAVCVRPSGRRSWYWVGRLGREMIRLQLGVFPEVTPEQARKKAAAVSAQVANGQDPREERQRVRSELTFSELFARYMDDTKKRSKDEDQKQYDRYLTKWGSRPLSSISHTDVATLHSKIGTGKLALRKKAGAPYAANRLVALLSKVFSFAIKHKFLAGENPARGIERFPEQSRDRFLKADELQRFFVSLEQEETLWQDYFTVALLTGARRWNVMSMRFGDVDFQERVWRIPDTKNAEPLTVPLVDKAIEILPRRWHEIGGEYVFPSKRAEGKYPHIAEPKVAWDRVTERAGLQGEREQHKRWGFCDS